MARGYESAQSAVVCFDVIGGSNSTSIDILGVAEARLTSLVIISKHSAVVSKGHCTANGHAHVEAGLRSRHEVADVAVNRRRVSNPRGLRRQSRHREVTWTINQVPVVFGVAVDDIAKEGRATLHIIQRVAIFFARLVVHVTVRNRGAFPIGTEIPNLGTIL